MIGVIRIVEIILAILSIIDIAFIGKFTSLDLQYGYFNYQKFQKLLSFILLLLVGLEISIMVVKHTAESVVEIILYAVARKILIYNTTSVKILIGVVTLLILYFIKIYMLKSSNAKIKDGVYKVFKKIQDKGKKPDKENSDN